MPSAGELQKKPSLQVSRDARILCIIPQPLPFFVALRGGATVIQLREKSKSSAEFMQTALRVKALTAAYGVPLVINDRIDIALAVDADGVHLGQRDIPGEVARKLLGPTKILGISAKTIEQANQAIHCGADYIGVGAVYGSHTKTDAVTIGLVGLQAIRAAVNIPIVAIGGITLGPAIHEIMRHGADGAAVVSAVFDTDDIELSTGKLVDDVRYGRNNTCSSQE